MIGDNEDEFVADIVGVRTQYAARSARTTGISSRRSARAGSRASPPPVRTQANLTPCRKAPARHSVELASVAAIS